MTTVPGQSPADEPRDLIAAIRAELVATAPARWKRIDIKAFHLVGVDHLSIVVLDHRNETVPYPAFPPLPLQKHLRRLRELRYLPGYGTWFSARLLLDHEYLHVVFNDGYDPNWTPAVGPGEWVRDLERFPRAPEHMPDWLRGYLREAGVPVPSVPPARADPPPGPLDEQEQKRILRALVHRYTHELPPHFDTAHVTAVAYGDTMRSSAIMQSAVRPNSITVIDVPPGIDDLFRELRAAMYRPGEGTWLAINVYVEFPDRYEAEYRWSWDDLREKPDLADCAIELERFPRSPEHTPEWIREGLAARRTPD